MKKNQFRKGLLILIAAFALMFVGNVSDVSAGDNLIHGADIGSEQGGKTDVIGMSYYPYWM